MSSALKEIHSSTPKPIPEAVLHYREEHRKIIPKWYSSKAHYLATTCVSLPLTVFAILHLENILPIEWLVIPFSFVFASLVEYIAHRYPLHRPMKPLEKAYQEHTVSHHHFFTHDAIEYQENRDFFRVFFPVWGVFLIQYFVGLPAALLIGKITTANAGYLTLIVGSLFFFIYETIHMICHLKPNHWIFKVPGLSYVREHHRIHHHKGRMSHYNFNVVIPIWDKLLGTLRKD